MNKPANLTGYESTALTEHPIDKDKIDYGPEAAASEFFRAVACDKGFKYRVHSKVVSLLNLPIKGDSHNRIIKTFTLDEARYLL